VRVLIFSNAPWAATGYGRQAALWAPRLRSLGHEVAVAAFHGLHGAPLTWTPPGGGEPVPVYPGSSEDPFARDILPGHAKHFRADLVLTLMDAWVLDPPRLAGMRMAHWLPADCSPLSQMDKRILSEGGGKPLAMSRFGQAQIAEAGWPDVPYVPHGADTAVFAPLPDREKLRDSAGLTGRFVIAVSAANQDPVRKGFGEQLEAYAAFCADAPEALMMIHSRDATGQGTDLRALAASLGIGGRVVISDQYQIAAGMTDDDGIARFLGLADLVSNCSYGEGFGLAVLEAQACGTPVAVTDCSAMSELCGSGWPVSGQRWFNRGHSAWWVAPSVPGITAAYREAYELWLAGGLEPYREKARDFALAYDADRVLAEYWPPALEALAAP
jgi:glycosyltransferase involved in cell wall biosynthesis